MADPEILMRQHHDRTGAACQMRQQVRVTGILMARKMQSFFAQWSGHDCAGTPLTGRVNGREDRAISQFSRMSGWLSEGGSRLPILDIDQLNIAVACQTRQRRGLRRSVESLGRTGNGDARAGVYKPERP